MEKNLKGSLVWVVNNNGFVRLYADEEDAKKEWCGIVEMLQDGCYYHSSLEKTTEIVSFVDDGWSHYVVFRVTSGYATVEYGQAWYGQLIVK